MQISEFRDLLKDYQEEDLRLLAVALYKAMPKSLRESKDIDVLVRDGKELLHKKQGGKTAKKETDVWELEPEVEEFLENAYAQNYFAPNRIIPKKERPKWRFKVKSYIKSLQSVTLDGEEGRTAADLLEKLYSMLRYGCSYYIFNTEDPFCSVGIEQKELLDIVLKKKFGNGINRESIKSAVALVVRPGVDRETTQSSLLEVLENNLRTPDSREMAIEEAKAQKAELDQKEKMGGGLPKKKWTSSMDTYERKEKSSRLTELVFRLYMDLCEYDEGILYFKANLQESRGEVALYCLLWQLFLYNLTDYWVREYEAGIKDKLEPRKSLQDVYQYTLDNGTLPKYYR